jgi:hypothetical protein
MRRMVAPLGDWMAGTVSSFPPSVLLRSETFVSPDDPQCMQTTNPDIERSEDAPKVDPDLGELEDDDEEIEEEGDPREHEQS